MKDSLEVALIDSALNYVRANRDISEIEIRVRKSGGRDGDGMLVDGASRHHLATEDVFRVVGPVEGLMAKRVSR